MLLADPQRNSIPYPRMKLLFVGLALVLSVGVVEALRCRVCKYKLPYAGCFSGADKTACERKEKCAIVNTSLGKLSLYYQQGCTSALSCGRERASDA
ncbi:UNVERIFIED_CONTAM: hypothetical protein H355_002482 [Colinus virginianus]|nr:hypothetical protein H355_002482 [Colinus virginianus]